MAQLHVQLWLFLAILLLFYSRLPALTRRQLLLNWIAVFFATVCFWNAAAIQKHFWFFGWTFDLPAW